MDSMLLSEMAKVCQAAVVGQDVEITSIAIDSRMVEMGSLFVAIKGETVDGFDYIEQAKNKGASAVLLEKASPVAISQVIVPNVVKALAQIAKKYREGFSGVVFGITGSAGKTSTKEMLVSILQQNKTVTFTQGNQNNEIGVPLTVMAMEKSHDYAVVEMGAAQQGDIAYLMNVVQPQVSVITNVGTAHVGRFGGESIIAKTKAEIYTELPALSKAVVNINDKYSTQWLTDLKEHNTLTVAVENSKADLSAVDLELYESHSLFSLVHNKSSLKVKLAVPGKHNIANALCAAGCAMQAGISLDIIVKGLEAFQSVPSRLEILKGSWGGVLIDDCYNANPGSVKAAIDVLEKYKNRKILVLGDMAELGDASQTAHSEVGRYAVDHNIDLMFSVGKDSEYAVKSFGERGKHFAAKLDLVDHLKNVVMATDTVLVKGSRSAHLEEVIEAIQAKVKS